jgi:hypothetical protein|tara:strand:+ start:22234 stop:22440 length:207 start_codon:yes stop_codon:yes gene_type:complete
MNVATIKQINKLQNQGDERMITPCLNAAHAINDIMDVWGSQSSAQGNEIANQLRKLADMIDQQNTQQA